MKATFLLALYGGPDQLMPITSGLTAVFTLLLIFWNKVLVALGKILNLLRRSGKTSSTGGGEASIKAGQGIDGSR